jgi:predicted dehydrogenase
MSDRKIRTAVIGVGYLGRWHAEKLAKNPESDLVAVVDVDEKQARTIARQWGVAAHTDYKEILGSIDAASVVTPTITHYEVTRDLLKAGVDVMCEKPFTATMEQADELIELAEENGRIIQVGHLERFNPAVEETFKRVKYPYFIECNRIAPFKARATDVDVALDLMIHDLDIILALVGEEPVEARAVGVPVLGEHADIVNARLEFPSGCVANVTASRLALKDERKMRIFQPDCYVSLDFKKRRVTVVNEVEYREGKRPKVKVDRPKFGKSDPLDKELKAFVRSVRERTAPRVGGKDGRLALSCAMKVRECAIGGMAKTREILGGNCSWVGAGPSEDA